MKSKLLFLLLALFLYTAPAKADEAQGGATTQTYLFNDLNGDNVDDHDDTVAPESSTAENDAPESDAGDEDLGLQ